MTTLIRGGLIHDAVHRGAYIADILLAGGKIAGIGTDLTAPAERKSSTRTVSTSTPASSMPILTLAWTATASGTRAATTTR